MNKEFDFENIERRMPYRTPPDFFAHSGERIRKRIRVENKAKRKKYALRIWIPITAIAAVFALVLSFPLFKQTTGTDISSNLMQIDPVIYASSALQTEMIIYEDHADMDDFIEELSNEELEDLMAQSDGDLFLF